MNKHLSIGMIGVLSLTVNMSCIKAKKNTKMNWGGSAGVEGEVTEGSESVKTPEPGHITDQQAQVLAAGLDMSKELYVELADNLNASNSVLDTVSIGADVGASFKFGPVAVFDVGAKMSFDDMFERQVLTEVIVGRAVDYEGTDATTGVFIDKDTVAANRYVKCRSQKVITDSNSFDASASTGISFLGLELGTRVGTGRKLSSSTDYQMSRGFYLTTEPMKLSSIFELCKNLAKNDVALQNINHISEIIKLNFSSPEVLDDVAKKIARGEKQNDFQFHNMRMDFQILKKEAGSIVYSVQPDTNAADPSLEVTVKYAMENGRVIVQEVNNVCKAVCENYVDTMSGKGLKGVAGTDLKKADAEKYIKMVATIFTAVAMDSK